MEIVIDRKGNGYLKIRNYFQKRVLGPSVPKFDPDEKVQSPKTEDLSN